jgi:FkbM family methyltransferase
MILPAHLDWLRTHPVTRLHPLRTWGRWFYWQLRQRVTARPMLMNTSNGTRLWIYPHEGLTGFWYLNLPDYEEMLFLRHYLRPGDIFYDIGANAGGFAVYAASFGCRVVAFEPIPHAFARLHENATENLPDCSIEPVNVALGRESGTLEMTTAFGTGNHVLKAEESGPSVQVSVTTLDAFVRERPCPRFLKLDVEGHELEVLLGAQALLAAPALEGLMVETFRSHNWQLPALRQLEELLGSNGFAPYRYEPGKNTIIPLLRPDEGDNNTFYFRHPEGILARLTASGDRPAASASIR